MASDIKLSNYVAYSGSSSSISSALMTSDTESSAISEAGFDPQKLYAISKSHQSPIAFGGSIGSSVSSGSFSPSARIPDGQSSDGFSDEISEYTPSNSVFDSDFEDHISAIKISSYLSKTGVKTQKKLLPRPKTAKSGRENCKADDTCAKSDKAVYKARSGDKVQWTASQTKQENIRSNLIDLTKKTQRNVSTDKKIPQKKQLGTRNFQTSRLKSGKSSQRKRFETRVGSRFVNLVEDVVTQMSLLGDSDDLESGAEIPHHERKLAGGLQFRPGKCRSKSAKYRPRKPSNSASTQSSNSAPRKSPVPAVCSSDKRKSREVYDKMLNMKRLSMYVVDQWKQFDKKVSNNRLSTAKSETKRLKNEAVIKCPPKKSSDTNEKKSVNISKLKKKKTTLEVKSSVGSLLPPHMFPNLGGRSEVKQVQKEVRQRLRVLNMPENSVRVLSGKDIKLTFQSGKLIVIGEGSTTFSVLGFLESEQTFIVLKLFKLPFAGGGTGEMIDQSVLASLANKTMVTPTFYGLVALKTSQDTNTRVHNVAMAYTFIGNARTRGKTTLTDLCEETSTLSASKCSGTNLRIHQLNAVTIVKDTVIAVIKGHDENICFPGLDSNKILLREVDGYTKPYLLSRLHPTKDHSLALPMIAYLGLKNKSKLYCQRKDSNVPPEATRKGKFTARSDVYQVGKIMQLVGQTFNIPQMLELSRKCLLQDPNKRPQIVQVLSQVEKIVNVYENIFDFLPD